MIGYTEWVVFALICALLFFAVCWVILGCTDSVIDVVRKIKAKDECNCSNDPSDWPDEEFEYYCDAISKGIFERMRKENIIIPELISMDVINRESPAFGSDEIPCHGFKPDKIADSGLDGFHCTRKEFERFDLSFFHPHTVFSEEAFELAQTYLNHWQKRLQKINKNRTTKQQEQQCEAPKSSTSTNS